MFLMKIIGFEKTTVRGSNDGAGEEGDAGFSTTSCKILATREPPEVFPFNEWRLDVRYLPAEPEDRQAAAAEAKKLIKHSPNKMEVTWMAEGEGVLSGSFEGEKRQARHRVRVLVRVRVS